MRIVAVADTHLFHGDLVVPDGDVFVHAGDMCRGGDLVELHANIEWMHSLPHRHKVIVAGNHDWAFAPCAHEPVMCRSCLAREQRAVRIDAISDGNPAVVVDLLGGITYLQDREVTIDGLRFYGTPWQPAFHDWAFNLPRGAPLAAIWSMIPTGIDVLITHGPPAGIGDRSPFGGRRAGCADLRARVTEISPRLHMFGHIHQDGGVWVEGATTFANVTTWECERAPTVIDIDATAVTPVTVPPSGRAEAM